MWHLFFPHDHRELHVKSLDGLRGIAVLFVVLSHSSIEGFFSWSPLDFKGIGKTGVYLFFILSAFLLDRQIIFKLRKGQADNLYWLNYVIRRFLRIYPLFAVALIVDWLVTTQLNLNLTIQ